ncbi:hypothetical protein [Hyunsoonleella ulvae]|nr:hypothetical protein [Hyunsoonleella ulvae]
MRTVIKIPNHLKNITEENLFIHKRMLSFKANQNTWKHVHHNMR